MSENNREKELKIVVEDDQIKITIGVSTMANAAQYGPYLQQFEEDEYIIDADVLAKSVIGRLQVEDEIGTTLVHDMFDGAIEGVVENGEHGIEFND